VLSPSIAAERSIEVNGIAPEKAAAVNAPHRFIPEYQQINAKAVTNTPYQRRASQPPGPIPESLFRGSSNAAGISHKISVITDTIVVCETGLNAEFLRTRKLDRHVRKMRKIYRQRRQKRHPGVV